LPVTRILEKRIVSPFRHVIPRPVDFFTKTPLFIIGALLAFVEVGPSSHPRIQVSFITEPVEKPSLVAIVALSVCWYMIQEGLVQQAKYLWNDIRDRAVDKEFSDKSHRSVASGALSLREATIQLFIRWIGGLLLGLFLDTRLFWLLCAISLVHILYELWAKPRGARIPLAPLFLVALGSPLRVLGGAMSISAHLFNLRFVTYLVAFTFFGIGYLATFWRIEAEHVKRNGIPISPRPHSEYYSRNGKAWQHLGFAGVVLCAVLLLADALYRLGANVSISDQIILYLQSRIGFSDLQITIAAYPAVFVFVSILSWTVRGPLSKLISRLARFKWFMGAAFLLVVMLTAILIATGPLQDHGELLSSLVLLLLSIVFFASYETISYEQYMLIYLGRNLWVVLRLWSDYLFKADTALTFSALLKVTQGVFTAERGLDLIEAQSK
jgi:4-hydroxybenzoate polyprenyltransferase